MNIREILFEDENFTLREQYDFLQTDKNLNGHMLFLTVGGSIAYGTNLPTSDIDIRGCASLSHSALLGLSTFEQFRNDETDTTIYALPKLFRMLLNCNPNCIEMLGTLPEHRLYFTPEAELLFNNTDLFLSQKASKSFGGYALGQLNRLTNMLGNKSDNDKTENLFRSCQKLVNGFNEKYASYKDSDFQVFLEEMDDKSKQVLMSANINRHSVREFVDIFSDLRAIVKSADEVNKSIVSRDSAYISKHMMHLIRLFVMAIDILEKEQVITYRVDEHDLLMDIRNGKYLTADGKPTDDFYTLVEDYSKRFEYAKANTSLPIAPDFGRTNELLVTMQEMIVNREMRNKYEN